MTPKSSPDLETTVTTSPQGRALFNIEIQDNSGPAPCLVIEKFPTATASSLPSLETLNWADPNLLMAELGKRLTCHGYVDGEWARLKRAHQCLTQFSKRVEKSGGRFRHPSCRAAHALLTMGGYHRVDSMSCCGTYGANENPRAKSTKGYCSRRRFCAACAWWASHELLSKFLPSFTAHQDRIHAFTLSWTFRDGDVGIPIPSDRSFDGQEVADLVSQVWDVGADLVRTITSGNSEIIEGCLMVESLTATHLMPLQINPHFHGVMCCDACQLEDIRQAIEDGMILSPDFAPLLSLGFRPSVKFDLLPTVWDFMKFVSYAYAAFGLGRPGSCLDEIYAQAWNPCDGPSPHRELNQEITLFVQAFDHACFDRNRAILTGRFWHRHRETLKCPPSKQNKDYVDGLYLELKEQEITARLCGAAKGNTVKAFTPREM